MRTNKHSHQSSDGFIALTSMLILSLVLSILIISTSTGAFFARFDVVDQENSAYAEHLADSCMRHAILLLAQNFSYDAEKDAEYAQNAGAPVAVQDDRCYVISTAPHAPRTGDYAIITITTRAMYRNAWSARSAEIKLANIDTDIPPTESRVRILSWN